MSKNNNLDERQEQALLKIEHNGCWFAFWGLLLIMVVEFVIYGPEKGRTIIAGEWILFMFLACYLCIACSKEGIWDRRLKADYKTIFLVAIIAAVASGAVFFLMIWRNYPSKIVGAIACGVFVGGIVFVTCLCLLIIMKMDYEKKRAKMEAEPEELED